MEVTPEPSPLSDVLVEVTAPLYGVDLTPLILVLAAVFGVLIVLRRRYPGLTPILIALLVLVVPFVLVTALLGVGSGFGED